MATTINSPLAGEIWHLSIEDLFAPVQETLRLGGDGPFVINLSVSTAPISIPKAPLAGCESAHIYQIQVSEDGRTRYRLRLGPFATEDEADAVLADVREVYPGALTATAGTTDLRKINALQEKLDSMQSVAKKPAQNTAAPMAPFARSAQPVLPVLPEPPVPPVLLAPEVESIPPAVVVPPELSTAWAMTIEPTPVAKPAVLIKAQAPVTRPPTVDKPATVVDKSVADIRSVSDIIDFEMPMPTAPAASAIPVLLEVQAPVAAAPVAAESKPAHASSIPMVLELEAPTPIAPAALKPVPVLAQPPASAPKVAVAAEPPVAASIPIVLELEAPTPIAPAAPKPVPVLAQPPAPAPKAPIAAKPAAAKPAVFAVPPTAPKAVAAPKPVAAAKPVAAPKSVAVPKSAPAPKPAVVLTQSVASKPSFFAPKAAKGNAKKAGAALTSLQHVATAIVPAPREVKKLPSPLPDLESTQTVRALTAPELENEDTSRWFVIQLSLSDQAFDPDTVPNLDIFSEYRLYSVAGLDQGRVVHALRLGFFSEEVGAVAVASYLGAYYDKPTIRRVSVAERERFSHQRVEARKDVGATGTHAVIEITSDLIARRKRTTPTPITEASLQPGGPQGASPTR